MKRKYSWALIVSIVGVAITAGFLYIIFSLSPGGGKLGAAAEADLNCSESDVAYRVYALSQISPYKIEEKDSTALAWWNDGGTDFLDYSFMNIRKRLYMITIDSDGSAASNESMISVRAYYNRNTRNWIIANHFTSSDKYRAERAMKYLTREMSSCL